MIPTSARPTDLLSGIRAVAAGDAVVAPALTRRMIETFAPHFPDAERPENPDLRLTLLTDREREVLTAIANGWTNNEIADRLILAESTVKTHIGRILSKIQARDRVQAVIFAYDTGLVRPA
nr:response regulator transcription factor [Catenulispora pinisilvae]